MKINSMYPIIVTDDAEKTMKFYEGLGFTRKHTTEMAADSPLYIIANGNVELEIMQKPKKELVSMQAGLHGIRMNVDDLEAAVETVKQSGGTILGGPFDTEWTSVYAVQDADGNNITLLKHKRK